MKIFHLERIASETHSNSHRHFFKFCFASNLNKDKEDVIYEPENFCCASIDCGQSQHDLYVTAA